MRIDVEDSPVELVVPDWPRLSMEDRALLFGAGATMRPMHMRPTIAALALLLIASSGCGTGKVRSQGTPTDRPSAQAPATPGLHPYGLLNDTAEVLSVTGCGEGCPRMALRPGEQLDFALGFGNVVVRRPNGRSTCLHIMNGLIGTTVPEREIIPITTGTGVC